jgi:hypothetical protein
MTGSQQIILFIWVGCGIGGALIAGSKGRSALGWGVLGFLFGLLALLVIALLPEKKTAY